MEERREKQLTLRKAQQTVRDTDLFPLMDVQLEILHARHQTRKGKTLTRLEVYTAFGYCAVTEEKRKVI